MMRDDGWRTCGKCVQARPPDQFPLHPKSKRRIAVCRHCMPQYKRGGNPARDRRRAWTLQNREKRAAHKAVEYATLRGDLVKQSCERCGADAHAHHDDYSKPLDVTWLCQLHHYARHEEIGRPMGKQRRAAV
jgi:hypothetical protein